MADVVAIILARGDSKGISNKNIIGFYGKPLIVWIIEQLQGGKGIDSIWVSLDSEEILSVSQTCGAETIHRPAEISSDAATSESGWLHVVDCIENKVGCVNLVVVPQITLPLWELTDIERGFTDFHKQKCDLIFSCSIVKG